MSDQILGSAPMMSDQILGVRGCWLSNLSDISLEWARHFGSMSIDTLGVYCTYVVIFCVQRFEVRQRGGSIPNCWLPVCRIPNCRVQLADSKIADIWKILLLQVEILVTVTQGVTNVRQANNTSTSVYSRASLLCYPTMCYNKLVSKTRKKWLQLSAIIYNTSNGDVRRLYY